MAGQEVLTPGALANQNCINNVRTEHPGLAGRVNAGCLGCSPGWLMALKGQQERLDACPGQVDEIETMGEVITGPFCQLPHGRIIEVPADD